MNKQLAIENKAREIVNNFQKAEVIRNGEKILKQGKYFNTQLKHMASRDIHDQRLYRISSELELAKQKISSLEVTEYQIIDKLK